MKSILFFTTLFLIPLFTFAQGDRLTEYQASNGITYKEGDIIKLARGSSPTGDFVYLTMGGWAVSANPAQNVIGKGYSNLAVDVKKIRKYKMKGVEKIIFTVGGGNITNYLLDIEGAIAECEIQDCNKNESENGTSSQDPLEKLKKLKELLDMGAITQEEFEVQKAKILKEIGDSELF